MILLLDVLFFGRRLDDVQLAALEVEEGVEVVGCDDACDQA